MAATTTANLNNYLTTPETFIEKYSNLPTTVNKRTLFEMSDDAYEEFKLMLKTSGKAALCTEAEIEVIRTDLHDVEGKLKLEDFSFVGNIKCENCARQFNYFDVYKTAAKFHGLEFLKWAILGTTKKMNLAPKSQSQMLRCSNCDHVWKNALKTNIPDDNTGYAHYMGGNAGYGGVSDDKTGYAHYMGGNAGYGAVSDDKTGYAHYMGGNAGYGAVSDMKNMSE